VQVRLVGKGVSVIASAVVHSGDTDWLYLDLSDYAGDLSGINAIRVLSRPLDGNNDAYSLNLYSVAFESETMSDAELASRMASALMNGDDDAPQRDEGELLTAIIITFIVAAASIALVIVFIVRQYKKMTRTANTKRVEKG
jgi:multisubunit Na+/H+ antiporter MnhC subunit